MSKKQPKQILVNTGYKPRDLQAKLHREIKRMAVLVCHRRFGKTTFCINEMLERLLTCQHRNPQGAYIGPTYSQAKRVAWKMLKEYTRMFPGVVYNEQELRCEIPRMDKDDVITMYLLSSDNPDALRGIYLDFAILDEYAQMDPSIYGEVVRPTLSDRLGRCIFIGTPKGQNHFYDRLKKAKHNDDWTVAIYRASETGIIPEKELDAIKAETDDAEYNQEYECDFSAALTGAYYAKEINLATKENRLTRVPFNRSSQVYTAWDLGMDDHTAIWFWQVAGKEIQFIDYYENSDQDIDHYAKILREKPYVYAYSYLPHDAVQKTIMSKQSAAEKLRGLGFKVDIIPRTKDVMTDIRMVRDMFNRVVFDEERCEQGIDCLKNYQRKWDPKRKVYMDKPHHDWSSHGADAFRYAILSIRDDNDFKDRPSRAIMDYDVFGDEDYGSDIYF